MTFRLLGSLSEQSSPHLPGLQLVQELPQIRLSYDAANSWLYADWRGPQTVASVLEGAELIVKAIAAGKHTKLLNDNTRLVGMNVTSKEWAGLHLLSRLFSAGLQYLAWVYSPDPLGRLHADYSTNESPYPFVLTFEEYNMAAEWLLQF